MSIHGSSPVSFPTPPDREQPPSSRASSTRTLFARDSLCSLQECPRSCFDSLMPFFSNIWQLFIGIYRHFFPQTTTRAPSELLDERNRISLHARQRGVFHFYNPSVLNYRPIGEVGFLSNCYPSSFRLWEIDFSHAEIAFQASKVMCDNPNATSAGAQFSAQCQTPGQAIERARAVSFSWSDDQREHWMQQRLNIMREIVFAKFSQNPSLKDLLLATEDAHIVFSLTGELDLEEFEYWGREDVHGENWLGTILVETRVRLGGSYAINRGVIPAPPA